jgi:hypothetical protein
LYTRTATGGARLAGAYLFHHCCFISSWPLIIDWSTPHSHSPTFAGAHGDSCHSNPQWMEWNTKRWMKSSNLSTVFQHMAAQDAYQSLHPSLPDYPSYLLVGDK